MTKKDFFILFIKLSGLYLFIQMFFYVLPQSYSFIALTPRADKGDIYYIFLFFGISILLFYLIIRYAHKIVNFFKLDKHFDLDDIDLKQITKTDIMQYAVIIIGGMLFINSFVDLEHQVLLYYQNKAMGMLDKFSNIRLVLPVLNILIGYLLLTNYDLIVIKISPKDKNQN